MRAAWIVSIAVLTGGGCDQRSGAWPTAPSSVSPSATLRLESGRYWLEIFALSIDDRQTPTCRVAVATAGGTFVTTPVQLAADGAEWVATSVDGAGSIEVRLRSVSQPTIKGVPLAGSLRGVGHDLSPLPGRPTGDTRVIVSGPGGGGATLEGAGSPGSSYLSGELVGAISFADGVGTTATCALARWSLQPATGFAGDGVRSAAR